MGIFQGDVKIRTAINLILEEMRKSPWLLDDVFSELLEDPYLAEYGAKEIANAKQWFLNNKISVLHKYRLDNQDYPCVTIAMAPSEEDDRESTMGDLTPFVEELTPEQIAKPIPYIVKPFIPASYVDGLLTAPEDLVNVTPGMMIVDPATGDAWVIAELDGNRGLKIEGAPTIAAQKIGIIPQYRHYRARREAARFRETYNIGCHVHGDPNQLIWLWSIVLYGLLRYRESMFNGRCFKLSSLKSSDILRDEAFQEAGENVYKRYIILSGLVEQSWLKSPKRVIEIANLGNVEKAEPGVNILVNTETPRDAVDPERDDTWLTTKEKKSSGKRSLTMKGTK